MLEAIVADLPPLKCLPDLVERVLHNHERQITELGRHAGQ
jgi:hypothetical protein